MDSNLHALGMNGNSSTGALTRNYLVTCLAWGRKNNRTSFSVVIKSHLIIASSVYVLAPFGVEKLYNRLLLPSNKTKIDGGVDSNLLSKLWGFPVFDRSQCFCLILLSLSLE